MKAHEVSRAYKILKLRWRTAPRPEGCRWCGWSQATHTGQLWAASRKWHVYERPTNEQVTARIKARRKLNQAFVMPDSGLANGERTQL